MVGELWDLRAVVEGFSRPRTMPESLSFSAPSPAEESMKKEEFVKPFCLLPPGEQSRHEEKQPFSPPPKSKKKRKAQQKKVICELPADALADNVWAWRKYGQKPIKDSPYPRGYYRCSSCKGCPARKQVERSRTKAGFFIVTYTAEHNHAPPIQRQKSPPLSGLLKMSPAAGEQRTPPPPPREVERETARNLCGDDVDGLSDEDFIFMDLDTLFEADVDGS